MLLILLLKLTGMLFDIFNFQSDEWHPLGLFYFVLIEEVHIVFILHPCDVKIVLKYVISAYRKFKVAVVSVAV